MPNLVIEWTTVLIILLLAVASPAMAGKKMSKADKKWLEEEVAVLITKDERAIFEDLETDGERGIFKRVFWARRDPTPLTPSNEFKDEYEARIQIVRRSLRVTGRSGTATDMGWIGPLGQRVTFYFSEVIEEATDTGTVAMRMIDTSVNPNYIVGMSLTAVGYEAEMPTSVDFSMEYGPSNELWGVNVMLDNFVAPMDVRRDNRLGHSHNLK